MRLLILSDIHGNYTALKAVMEKAVLYKPDACVILGDIIDYGPHSNEVIEAIDEFPMPKLCNISGNHEYAIRNSDFSRFSSDRGVVSAKYTQAILSERARLYINNEMSHEGKAYPEIDGRKCLVIHGSLEDEYWGSITPDVDPLEYAKFDLVFSGHSHIPHYFEKYVKTQDQNTRNKRKIIFINPGSVGQPRNLNNKAQFAVFDTATEEVVLCKAEYDIASEQAAFSNNVDIFYKERLAMGI